MCLAKCALIVALITNIFQVKTIHMCRNIAVSHPTFVSAHAAETNLASPLSGGDMLTFNLPPLFQSHLSQHHHPRPPLPTVSSPSRHHFLTLSIRPCFCLSPSHWATDYDTSSGCLVVVQICTWFRVAFTGTGSMHSI